MSVLPVIPDAEALVASWLREHPDIEALEARVAGSTPPSMTKPWIRVTQLAAPRIGRARTDHAIDYLLQLDCYAGGEAAAAYEGQAEASLLARTARAVLTALEGTTADDTVIGRVRVNVGPRSPDTTLEPARDRYILTADILMHHA